MANDVQERYARAIDASKRVRWDLNNLLDGREFDLRRPFLPKGLSLENEFLGLSAHEKLLLSQLQGRTYANIFGLVERFISAKVLQLTQNYWFGDQVALEALIRMADEELKHQELFRRMEVMMTNQFPRGYKQAGDPNSVAQAVLAAPSWSVLALTLHIELFTQAHYRASIAPGTDLCPLWQDVFLHHWREEAQHAILDELEFRRVDSALTLEERAEGVDGLIALVGAVDSLLQDQARADAGYFSVLCGRRFSDPEIEAMVDNLMKAYRWQYIVSGVTEPKFQNVLKDMLNDAQLEKIAQALSPLAYAKPNEH
jgi:hypothetical protein